MRRPPTEAEWERIWTAATAWEEKHEEVPAEVTDFVLQQAPDIFTPTALDDLLDERIGDVPLVPIPLLEERMNSWRAPSTRGTPPLPPPLAVKPKRSLLRQIARGIGLTFVILIGTFVAVVIFGTLTEKSAAKRRAADAAEFAATKAAQEAAIEKIISERKIDVGFTPDLVRRSWGEPKSKSVSGGVGHTTEFWHYEAQTLYFVDGRLVRWTTRS